MTQYYIGHGDFNVEECTCGEGRGLVVNRTQQDVDVCSNPEPDEFDLFLNT